MNHKRIDRRIIFSDLCP